jgi:hypothetical protein
MLEPTEPQGLQLLANARHRERWFEVLNRRLHLLEQAQLVADADVVRSQRVRREDARTGRGRLAWELRRDGHNAVQVPLLRDALESMHTSVFEHKSRTCG